MKLNIFTILLLTLYSSTSFAGVLSNTIWERVAKKSNIDPEILYSVSLKEARMLYTRDTVRPHPWTIRNAEGPQRYKSRIEAQIGLTKALKTDPYIKIDIGLMQINWHYHKHRVENPFDLLDPKRAVEIGAEILSEAINSKPGDLEYGIGSYYSNQEKRARSYGSDILRMAKELKKLQ